MNAEYFNKLINDGDTANCAITSKLLLNKTNPVCFDIGAFHGIWGEGIILENQNAIVHFFEPNPTNFEALKKNIGDREGAHFYAQAISDKEGTLEFLVDGPTSNSREETVLSSHRTISVKCSTIDPFLKNNKYVDIVKIDTEGHELHVLRTLLPYVKEKRVGAIVTEFSPFWYGNDPDEVYNATDLLYDYFDVYKYCYALSRHGEVFTVQITPENLDEFIYDKFVRHIQTDIYFMNEEITTIPVYQFKYGTYYA